MGNFRVDKNTGVDVIMRSEAFRAGVTDIIKGKTRDPYGTLLKWDKYAPIRYERGRLFASYMKGLGMQPTKEVNWKTVTLYEKGMDKGFLI